MILIRTDFDETGIFGILTSDDGNETYMTLEHAYRGLNYTDSMYSPKIPNGVFKCVRRKHQLEGMLHTIETFEITGVVGHKDLLFHPGNTNADSSGCILLGLARNDVGVLNSREAFRKFMESKIGVNIFTLTVT